ncbi:MAG TPA: ATP-binding cassette domain-containing protein [Granulicella sp.]|nr:ATP-binding cassette domain-containing protein [Granulicella sp.]
MSETRPHLKLRVGHRIGAIALDVAFEARQPWTVLFGPSGSGKSTVLRSIAGLVRPERACITLGRGGLEQVATDTAAGVFVTPHRRWVRWSAQAAALFPHMTVRENVRFGVGEGRGGAADIVGEALGRFRLAGMAEKRPAQLSGGERQRVSVARAAAAADGRLILLDEPFSGLDAALRDELLDDLQGWLAVVKTPVLSVTHDVGEAFQLGAEVIKIGDGRVVDQGPVAVVLAAERERLLGQLRGR